jgi:hypothetical protein
MKTFMALAALGVAGALGLGDNSVSRAEVREVSRLQVRLDSVVRELTYADVSSLDAKQLANRLRIIATLRTYRDRGKFPNNYDFKAPTPYFFDRKTGTRCAVAFLLEASGRPDIAERVARTNNNVWVRQLAGDVEFRSWLKDNGLTLAEAARIQAPYIIEETPVELRSARSTSIASLAAVGTTLFALGSDPTKSTKPLIVSAVVGAVSIAVGTSGTGGAAPADPFLRKVSVGAGLASIGMAALRQVQHVQVAKQVARAKSIEIRPTTNISEGTAGLTVALRF